ncbi:MAG: triple tyrosine motif-containing protein, partial [Pseudomonadales bacterium]
VLSVYEDRGKALWVGTHGDGLCRMDPDTGKFETYRHDPEEASSLSSNDAWKVIEDGAGNLWIGTSDGGLNVFRAADRQRGVVKFTRIGVAEGLASNVVYGLESDTRGRIWASGNRGLSRVELDTGSVRRFSVVDGLQGNEFNFAAAFRSRDGRLFFGGLQGFNAFYPHEIGANTYAPPIALTRFLRLNEETNLDALRDENDLVTFRHTDRLVTFEYAALDFTDPQSNSYEHRLDGFDEGWVQDGNRHRLTYTNLLPGKYTLRVRAANKEGVRSESEFRVPFQVLPAPWVTWWAQTGYLLGILLVAFMIYRVYARRMAYAMEIQEINDTLLEEITARKGKEVE